MFTKSGMWMEPDGVTGVTEILQLAASATPRPELEALRGRDDPPSALAGPAGSEPVRIFRTLVGAGGATRGWDIVKASEPVEVALAGEIAPARVVPVVAGQPGLSVVELRVMHR